MGERTMAEAFEQAAVVASNPRHLTAGIMQHLGVNWMEADAIFEAEIKKTGEPLGLDSLASLLRRCARAARPDNEGAEP